MVDFYSDIQRRAFLKESLPYLITVAVFLLLIGLLSYIKQLIIDLSSYNVSYIDVGSANVPCVDADSANVSIDVGSANVSCVKVGSNKFFNQPKFTCTTHFRSLYTQRRSRPKPSGKTVLRDR